MCAKMYRYFPECIQLSGILSSNNMKVEFATIPACYFHFQTFVNHFSWFQYPNFDGAASPVPADYKARHQIWLFSHLSHSSLVSQSFSFFVFFPVALLKIRKNVKNEVIFQNMLMNVKFLRFFLPSPVSFSSGFIVSRTLLLYKDLCKAFLSPVLLTTSWSSCTYVLWPLSFSNKSSVSPFVVFLPLFVHCLIPNILQLCRSQHTGYFCYLHFSLSGMLSIISISITLKGISQHTALQYLFEFLRLFSYCWFSFSINSWHEVSFANSLQHVLCSRF